MERGATFDGRSAVRRGRRGLHHPQVARTALIVNLLTEDNLPSYHHESPRSLAATARGDLGAPWTAERATRTAIRDYLR